MNRKLKMLIILGASLIGLIVIGVVVLVVMQSLNVVKIQTITFNEPSKIIYVGQEAELSASFLPRNAKNTTIEFTIENEETAEIVSVDRNVVVIKALRVGVTNLIATAEGNKKVVEKCKIDVRDVSPQSIQTEKDIFHITLADQLEVPLVLSPSRANPASIVITNFDNNHLEYANINIVEGVPVLTSEAKIPGRSVILISAVVNTSEGTKIIFSKEIVVESVEFDVEDFRIELSSSVKSDGAYVAEAFHNHQALVYTGYTLYVKAFADLNKVKTDITKDVQSPVANADGLVIIYNSSQKRFEITATSVFSGTKNVLIEYFGETMVIDLIYFDSSSVNSFEIGFNGKTDTLGVYHFEVGESAQIQVNFLNTGNPVPAVNLAIFNILYNFHVPEDSALIEFRELEIVTKQSSPSKITLSFSFDGDNYLYWDDVFRQSLMVYQFDVEIMINPIDFIEN